VSARPRLKAHLQVLRRAPGVAQLGLEPENGLLLDGVTEAEAVWVAGLDGTRTLERALDDAVAAGIPPGRARTLIALLRANGALVEAPANRWHFASLAPEVRTALRADATALAAVSGDGADGFARLAARARRAVAVAGSGPLAAEVARLLRAAGSAAVLIGPYAGWPPSATSGEAPPPAVAVLVGAMPAGAAAGQVWHRAGVPHLPVAVGTTSALVGPVVHPGRTACLRCMDLSRSEADSCWGTVLAQIAPGAVSPLPAVEAETSLLAVTASVTAMVVLSVLDGQDGRTGLSLEVALPWPEVVQRQWFPHPGCACGAARRSSGLTPGLRTRAS
jgi:hypothetical protein